MPGHIKKGDGPDPGKPLFQKYKNSIGKGALMVFEL
jgi:hypothetical protein